MIDLKEQRGSGPPLGSNGLNSRLLFYERLHFKENIKHQNNYDFWYYSPYYGRVDHNATPVYVNESYLLPVSDNYFALNFVSKALQDLQQFVADAARNNSINKGSMLTSINVSRAWQSVLTEYNALVNEHMQAFIDVCIGSRLDKAVKVNNLDTFLSEYVKYVEAMGKFFPVTRSAYILSNKCSPLTSGLMVELSSMGHDNDLIKQEVFLKDSNYKFYELAAARFGFAIDPNAPWRLIAKIGSTTMQNYMKAFNVTYDNIFDTVYFKSYMTDYFSFVTYMTEMYEIFRRTKPEIQIPRVCQETGRVYHQTITREKSDEFSVSYVKWLKSYMKIRMFEQGLSWTDSVFTLHLTEVISVAKTHGMALALEYMEKVTGGLDKLAYPQYREEAYKFKQE